MSTRNTPAGARGIVAGMKNTLQNVPTRKLRKWLDSVERVFGRNCPTARIYRGELARRAAAAAVSRSAGGGTHAA